MVGGVEGAGHPFPFHDPGRERYRAGRRIAPVVISTALRLLPASSVTRRTSEIVIAPHGQDDRSPRILPGGDPSPDLLRGENTGLVKGIIVQERATSGAEGSPDAEVVGSFTVVFMVRNPARAGIFISLYHRATIGYRTRLVHTSMPLFTSLASAGRRSGMRSGRFPCEVFAGSMNRIGERCTGGEILFDVSE